MRHIRHAHSASGLFLHGKKAVDATQSATQAAADERAQRPKRTGEQAGASHAERPAQTPETRAAGALQRASGTPSGTARRHQRHEHRSKYGGPTESWPARRRAKRVERAGIPRRRQAAERCWRHATRVKRVEAPPRPIAQCAGDSSAADDSRQREDEPAAGSTAKGHRVEHAGNEEYRAG